MFVVISTEEKGETYIQAVSATFLVKQTDGSQKYYYPKKSNKVKKAILEQWTPNAAEFYEIEHFKIVSKYYGN